MPYDFPDPSTASEEGLVGIGGDYDVETLLNAYKKGIFPWPIQGYPITWFCPPERGVLFFKEIHFSKSLQKKIRTNPFEFTINERFEEVIEKCQSIPRTDPHGVPGTWITDELKEGYINLHKAGYAKSVEVWNGKKLIGGLYGVLYKNVFAGESMYHEESDASKLAVLFISKVLEKKGASFIDIQQLTPHMQKMGAREITRDEFLRLIEQTQKLRPEINLEHHPRSQLKDIWFSV